MVVEIVAVVVYFRVKQEIIFFPSMVRSHIISAMTFMIMVHVTKVGTSNFCLDAGVGGEEFIRLFGRTLGGVTLGSLDLTSVGPLHSPMYCIIILCSK